MSQEIYKDKLAVSAQDSNAWRKWLEKNGTKEDSVWLIIYNKDSNVPSLTYSQAVDQAICFGWIDAVANKRDDKSRYQYFARRSPKSNWSRVNKQKVERLLEEGLIVPEGLATIELAKQNGTWDALNDVENLLVPADLAGLFNKDKKAQQQFEAFSRSVKRAILEWLQSAKTDATRQKRLKQIVRMAAVGKSAQFDRE
jgi:uncharacterized protein YdeI (YjbR/CyaY-like superfamily)